MPITLPPRSLLRLSALLALAAGSFLLAPEALLMLAVSLLTWAGLQNSSLPGLWASRVLRLKWFFLAIFILYLFGGMQVQGQPDWAEAGYRVGVLITLVGIVAVSLDDIAATELADGLGRLLRPLGVFGLPVGSFSRRLAVTLDAVAHMQTRVRGLSREGGFAAVAAVCAEAEAYQATEPSTVAVKAPAIADWLYLAGSLGLVVGLQWL